MTTRLEQLPGIDIGLGLLVIDREKAIEAAKEDAKDGEKTDSLADAINTVTLARSTAYDDKDASGNEKFEVLNAFQVVIAVLKRLQNRATPRESAKREPWIETPRLDQYLAGEGYGFTRENVLFHLARDMKDLEARHAEETESLRIDLKSEAFRLLKVGIENCDLRAEITALRNQMEKMVCATCLGKREIFDHHAINSEPATSKPCPDCPPKIEDQIPEPRTSP